VWEKLRPTNRRYSKDGGENGPVKKGTRGDVGDRGGGEKQIGSSVLKKSGGKRKG